MFFTVLCGYREGLVDVFFADGSIRLSRCYRLGSRV